MKDNLTKEMNQFLSKATKNTTNKSYEAEDKKTEVTTPVKKESGTAGRKTIADKKKPRQVYYNNADYKVIEEIAEEWGMDTKNFMMMCINQKVKSIQKNKMIEIGSQNKETITIEPK